MIELRLRNFLAVEGRLLARGQKSHLTVEEWLYLYERVENQLVGAQIRILADYASAILKRKPRLAMESVAV